MPDAANANDSFRIRKFLKRADLVLQGPIFEFRAMDEEGFKLNFTLRIDKTTGATSVANMSHGVEHFTQDVLEANAARCRVFLLEDEDVNLIQIVGVVRRWVTPVRRAELAKLKTLVQARVKDGKLRGAHIYSGRMDTTDPQSNGELLGNDQIAMDFIYGHLVHQDRDAEARLANVATDDTLTFSVVSKLNDLMQCVYWARFEINRALQDGSLVLAPEPVSSRAATA